MHTISSLLITVTVNRFFFFTCFVAFRSSFSTPSASTSATTFNFLFLLFEFLFSTSVFCFWHLLFWLKKGDLTCCVILVLKPDWCVHNIAVKKVLHITWERNVSNSKVIIRWFQTENKMQMTLYNRPILFCYRSKAAVARFKTNYENAESGKTNFKIKIKENPMPPHISR